VIALGLAVELIAAGLLVVGVVVLGELRASTALWSSIVAVLVGLVVVAVGVQRARPPRRSVAPPLASMSPVAGASDGD
jgi:hypothetical protein